MDTFAKYLEQRRSELGLTKAQLAKKIGWTPMYYGRFESGDVYPTSKNLSKFAYGLKVEESTLYRFLKKKP